MIIHRCFSGLLTRRSLPSVCKHMLQCSRKPHSMMSQKRVHVVKIFSEPRKQRKKNNEKSIFFSFSDLKIWRRNLQCGISEVELHFTSSIVKEEERRELTTIALSMKFLQFHGKIGNFTGFFREIFRVSLFLEYFLTFFQVYLIIFHLFFTN